MHISQMARKAEKLITNNSPLILTVIGVSGVLTTAYLAAKATAQATRALDEENEKIANMDADARDKWLEGRDSDTLTGKEKFEKLYKLYIPTAVSGTLTCAAIVGSNRIGARRAAALASAVNISERAYHEYRAKTVEKLGEKADREIRQEVAKERTDKVLSSGANIITTAYNEQLCIDAISNQPFESSMNAIMRAEIEIYNMIMARDHATLSDFYDLLGIPTTSMSGELGWNHDHPMKLITSGIITADDRPAIYVDFERSPVPNPERFRKS